jgi:mannobiose 2-epimerase
MATADKGAILNARIVWTFSAAARVLGEDAWRRLAERAYEYLVGYLWDLDNFGLYWMVDHRGKPVDTRKHVYAQAFGIYGMSEYFRATGFPEALERAKLLFQLLETHCRDDVHNGYYEAFDRIWHPLEDVRLSEKDAAEPKSMNTHLHVLEAFVNLYRVWPDRRLEVRIEELIDLFLDRILDRTSSHFRLFFDHDWTPRSALISYGHDIESAWLLQDAAEVLGNEPLRRRTAALAVDVARATLEEGVDEDGGVFNAGVGSQVTDYDKHWWPQAEAVVGFVNAYQNTIDVNFLKHALKTWAFAMEHMVDRTNGEWFFRVSRDHVPYAQENKLGPWKCPYHTVRACLEVERRLTEFESV